MSKNHFKNLRVQDYDTSAKPVSVLAKVIILAAAFSAAIVLPFLFLALAIFGVAVSIIDAGAAVWGIAFEKDGVFQVLSAVWRGEQTD